MGLLDGQIANIVAQATSGVTLSLTLKETIEGTYDPSKDTYASETDKSYTVEGVVDEYSAFQIANGLAEAGDRKIIVIANSLPSGVTIDTSMTIVDDEGTEFHVVDFKRDPASATYVIQARK